MPIQSCRSGGKPGYKWGQSGKCYTYTSGNEQSRKSAREKARKQGVAIEISRGRFAVHSATMFEKFEERNIDDGVKVVFAKYKAFDRWTTQAVEFDEEKFDTDSMVAWLESHDMLPLDVCLDEWDPEDETNPLVKVAMVDELVEALTWEPQTEENEDLRKKLAFLAEENADSDVSFEKAVQILNAYVNPRLLSPTPDGQEIWIDGIGRWIVTENLIYRPESQIPFVLHKDSPVPPKDVSWLPSHIQYALGDKFSFWEKDNKADRTKVRNSLIDKLDELKLFE